MTVRLIQGDCRDVLSTLPAESFDCIVTSPPYWGLRDYGVDGQIGLEPTLDAYVETMREVARALWRVLKPEGCFWLNLGDCYAANRGYQVSQTKHQGHDFGKSNAARVPDGLKPKDLCGVPWRVAFALQADGWWLRSAVVWAKPNPMPESVTDRPTSAYEMVFLLTKAERYFYDAEAIAEPSIYPGDNGLLRAPGIDIDVFIKGRAKSIRDRQSAGVDSKTALGSTRNARNVWTIATQPFKGSHFATMPPDLAERCIKAGSSERGCCPSCGKSWERIREKSDEIDTSAKGSRFDVGKTGARDGGDRTQAGDRFRRVSSGWRPTCTCPAHEPIQARILDPFAGSGTTGLVADRLGRHATLIELNPSYRDMGAGRITDDAPLLAEVY